MPEDIESVFPHGELTPAEREFLLKAWGDLDLLPQPQPTPALRAQFYQKLNAVVHARPAAVAPRPWWKRALVLQIAAACAIFVGGFGLGHIGRTPTQSPTEIAQLRSQVEGLRETVALSLMEKPSASSRLQGVEWSSQVNRPDQELTAALVTTLNQDQNINVRLASLDALEKFTADPSVRQALEKSISTQQSPLVQIALIDALVHIRDNAAAQEFQQLSRDTAVNAAVRQRAQWGLQKLHFE
jgi:hypothetical protein